jgi:hypothetical protein
VDWVMEDVGQADYLLHIHDFTAEDVLETLNRIQLGRDSVVKQIASYLRSTLPVSKLQYDTLADLAVVHQPLLKTSPEGVGHLSPGQTAWVSKNSFPHGRKP